MKIRRIDLQVGYSCNNNCIHCFNLDIIRDLKAKRKPLDKTTEKIKEILRKARNNGVKEVVFTGGEPTIRKDFFELLAYAKELEFRTGLQTNGRTFSDTEFARKTLELDKNMGITIPLHHVDKKIHDAITRVKGSWKQTVRGIKNLVKLGANNISLKMVILKQNYRFMKEFVEFAHSLNIHSISFASVQAGGWARINWFKISPYYTEIKPYLREALERANRLGMKINTFGIPFCLIEGYENFSEELRYGKMDLEGENFQRFSTRREDGIRELEILKRVKPKACKHCKFFNSCLGVWEEYVKFYGDEEFKLLRIGSE